MLNKFLGVHQIFRLAKDIDAHAKKENNCVDLSLNKLKLKFFIYRKYFLIIIENTSNSLRHIHNKLVNSGNYLLKIYLKNYT